MKPPYGERMKAPRPSVGCKLGARKGDFWVIPSLETKGKLDLFYCYSSLKGILLLLSSKRMCKHKSSKFRRTLPWLEKRVINRKTGQGIICRKTMLGTSALHMAARPTEDNTVRTKTAAPDWYNWGIFRPFPRSHIKCQIPFQVWYTRGSQVQTWLCRSVTAPDIGTFHVPNETQRSQGPKGLTSQNERPLHPRPHQYHDGKPTSLWEETICRQWYGETEDGLNSVLLPESIHLIFGYGSQRDSISDTEPRIKWRQWWPTYFSKNAAIPSSGLDGSKTFWV